LFEDINVGNFVGVENISDVQFTLERLMKAQRGS
jgi:hypothetical protein